VQQGNYLETGLDVLVKGTDWRDVSHKPCGLHVWWTPG